MRGSCGAAKGESLRVVAAAVAAAAAAATAPVLAAATVAEEEGDAMVVAVRRKEEKPLAAESHELAPVSAGVVEVATPSKKDREVRASLHTKTSKC